MSKAFQWCVAASIATGSATALAQDSFGGPARPGGPAAATSPAAPPARPPAQGTPPAAAAGADLDKLMAKERQDLGVPPVSELHSGAMHGPTPAKIPGGQVITTKGLIALVQGRQVPFLLFDVLGGPEMLPGAIPAAAAAQPGSFDDEVQRGFGAYLEKTTRGDKRVAMVFYCQSTYCWMSYNAALRAIRLGYGNVLWYRGGIEAWKEAGLSLAQPPRPGPQRP